MTGYPYLIYESRCFANIAEDFQLLITGSNVCFGLAMTLTCHRRYQFVEPILWGNCLWHANYICINVSLGNRFLKFWMLSVVHANVTDDVKLNTCVCGKQIQTLALKHKACV